MHTIENEELRVMISNHGAELSGIFDKRNNREVLWNADPKYWKRHAPVLFPNVGRFYKDTCLIGGETYTSGPVSYTHLGDVKFSMIVSCCTMWACRFCLCVFLIRVMGFGPMGVWIGMFADWTLRGIIFTWRFHSRNWLQHKVI